MVFQTDFESYTDSTLHPTIGGAGPSVPTIIDHAWLFGVSDPGVKIVAGLNSAKAVQFHYDGVIQESHGVELIGGALNTFNTGPGKTTVMSHYLTLVADNGVVITDTMIVAKIKWFLFWHGSPNNTRVEWATIDHNGYVYYGPAYINWSVIDQAETASDGVQPIGPTIGTVANGSRHRFTYLFKPNTSVGSRDGRALLWIDGHLVCRVEQSGVGVVARSDGMPWCNQEDVDNLIVGYGAQTPQWGGPLTAGEGIPFAITIDDVQWWTVN